MLIISFIVAAIIISYATLQVPDTMTRGLLGALIAFLFLVGLQKWLVDQANKMYGKTLTLFDLIVTSEDNRFSLSRFQIYVWTIWVVIAFAAMAFAKKAFADIPPNLAVLMGINGFTAVLSTAITDPQKAAANKADKPNFFSDLFLDKNKTLDLPRTQMFIWTFVILAAHILIVSNDYISGKYNIQDVSSGLLILMGASNGAYLGVKATEKK